MSRTIGTNYNEDSQLEFGTSGTLRVRWSNFSKVEFMLDSESSTSFWTLEWIPLVWIETNKALRMIRVVDVSLMALIWLTCMILTTKSACAIVGPFEGRQLVNLLAISCRPRYESNQNNSIDVYIHDTIWPIQIKIVVHYFRQAHNRRESVRNFVCCSSVS